MTIYHSKGQKGLFMKIKGYEIGNGKPLICVPVMATEKDEIIAEIKKYVEADIPMIEWRVDYFSAVTSMNAIREVLVELKEIVKDNILVYTYRSKGQGGTGTANADLLYDIHEVAAETGVVDLIDVEYFESKKPVKEIKKLQEMGAAVIASHHDFEETPEAGVIHMLLERMNESGADIVKLALMPNNIYDVFSLLEQTAHFHENHPNRPIITMSMGPKGSISRVAGEYYGSCVTFGAGEQASAPGQLPYKELDNILNILNNCLQ